MMKFSTSAAAGYSAGHTDRGLQPDLPLPLHPQLGARIEGIAYAVTEHVQR
jgi:hypothetical protein